MTIVHTPWRIDVKHGPDGEQDYAWIVDNDGSYIGTLDIRHAYHIVKAVNVHSDLVASLGSLYAAMAIHEGTPEEVIALAQASETLAKARSARP